MKQKNPKLKQLLARLVLWGFVITFSLVVLTVIIMAFGTIIVSFLKYPVASFFVLAIIVFLLWLLWWAIKTSKAED